jgi:hypothetical protein
VRHGMEIALTVIGPGADGTSAGLKLPTTSTGESDP